MNLEVPREGGGVPVQHATDDYELLARAAEFYQLELRGHPPAIEYLKSRGLTGKIALEYCLGYAPATWDRLKKQLQASASLDQLVRAGLIIRTDEGRYYDRFRNRVMFPLRDTRGRVIGFGGRIIGEGTPKYLNSPETPLFHKGRSLYGWYESRKALGKVDSVVVVEGYMDVVALAQYEVRNAVATLGTATTREHIRQIYRNAHEIVFCFDGDRAGRTAAWRALENLLPEFRDGVDARFMFLPEGEDPDSLIRSEGREGWLERVARATPVDTYLLEKVQDGQVMTGAGARAQLVTRARPLLNRLQQGVFKERLAIEIGKLAGVSIDKLFATIRSDSPGTGLSSEKIQIQRTPVRLAIALLLNHPTLARKIPEHEWLRTLELPGVSLLIEIIETLRSDPHISAARIIERYRSNEHYQHLLKLMEYKSPHTDDDNLERLFQDVIGMLENKRRDQRAHQLLSKARNENLSYDEKTELRQLLQHSTGGQHSEQSFTS